MGKRTGWLVSYLALMLALSGCTTLAGVRNAKGTGAVMIFDVPFDTVWTVIPQVVTETGLTVVSTNKAEGYILAERGIGFSYSWGEKVAIFVEKAGSDSLTSVEVVSKASLVLQAHAPNWIAPILEKIQQRLEGS